MTSKQRETFKTFQDWNNYITGRKLNGQELLDLRKTCYIEIEKLRKRPLIVYATQFINVPKGTPNTISLDNIDGFTDLATSIDHNSEVDILLHSPGGSPDATERVVNIIRQKFSEVHFLIPHSAYSAATMLALSGNTITLHPSATLGPIDPQLDGIPARSIKRGFEKVKETIRKEGPESLPAYIPLIEKYSLHLLELCDDSETLSKNLVTTWLKDFMFAGSKGMTRKINKAVKYFSNYDQHLLHSRPLHYEKLKEFDLKIVQAEGRLKELMWEAYLLISGFLNISPFVKLFENNQGISWGKQFSPQQQYQNSN